MTVKATALYKSHHQSSLSRQMNSVNNLNETTRTENTFTYTFKRMSIVKTVSDPLTVMRLY